MVSDKCHSCGKNYEDVGKHLALSSCTYPTMGDTRISVLEGLVMGDGYVDTSNKNPRVQVMLTEEEALEYLSDIFSDVSSGVRVYLDGEESLDKAKDDDTITVSSDAIKYKDVYRWQTMCHPKLEYLVRWYKKGKKEIPGDIRVTPELLTWWYVSDGTYFDTDGHDRAQISACNYLSQREKVNDILRESGVTGGIYWNIQERDKSGKRASVVLTVDQTTELFEYMNGPIPGFKYKWR